MSYATINALLDAHLAAATGLPPLQLENTQNIGVTGQPFARATLVTTESAAVTNLRTEYGGLYVVDLYYPLNAGLPAANAMADTVIAHFKNVPQHTLSGSGVSVHLDKAWRESLGRRDQFYALQVKVRWRSLF